MNAIEYITPSERTSQDWFDIVWETRGDNHIAMPKEAAVGLIVLLLDKGYYDVKDGNGDIKSMRLEPEGDDITGTEVFFNKRNHLVLVMIEPIEPPLTLNNQEQ